MVQVNDQLRTGAVVTIQMARLGDFLQTTPLLHALKHRYPDSPMVALVTPAQAALASRCQAVDQVWELEPQPLLACFHEGLTPAPGMQARWSQLTGHLASLDVAEVYNLNLGPLGASLARVWPLSRIHAWRLSHGGQHLVGEAWTRYIMALVGNRRLTRLHLCDILATYADYSGELIPRLDYQAGPDSLAKAEELLPDSGPRVVLQLGSNSPLRRWPVEYFAALGEALLAQGVEIILVGTNNERLLNQRLLDEIGPISRRVTNLVGKTSLPELGGVLASCDLVISGDTGTLHLASAVGARLLALYMGPAAVHETGPYGAGHLVLQARDECGPCQEQNPPCKGAAPCRRLLSPQAVYLACARLLEGSRPGQAAHDLNLGPLASPLVSHFDEFGQNYQNINPLPLDSEQILALAMREAGRMLLRPNYQFDAPSLQTELVKGYASHPEARGPKTGSLIRQANSLVKAAESQDQSWAKRIMAEEPNLAYLAGLVGLGQPPRLKKACLAAARTLDLIAEIN
jgi:ADP-heptose:LPS heptosyltransferase